MSNLPADHPSPQGSPPGPRAFAQAVGMILQAVGATVLFVTCCLCCGVAFFEGPIWQDQPSAQSVTPLDPAGARTAGQPPQSGLAVLLTTSSVGGLCLVGFGVGMQADRGRLPAVGAALTTTFMTLAYALAAFRLSQQGAPKGFLLLALAALIGVAILALLALPSMVQVLRHPSPGTAPPILDDPPDDPWARRRDKDGNLILTADQARRREKELLAELDRLRATADRKNAYPD